MSGVFAFLMSPLGGILIASVPKLVGEIIALANEKGLLKPEEILTYIQTQKQWADIPPAK